MSRARQTVALLLRSEPRRLALAALLGFATLASGVGLMGASAWLIATAALHPSIAVLQVAIVGVRVFGISRGFFRYLERLVSHDVTFRALARLRAAVYRALEPLSPARLATRRRGDLLARLVSDVDGLDGFFVRVLGPACVALGGLLLAAAILFHSGAAGPLLAETGTAGLLVGGVVVPWFAWRLGRDAGRRVVSERAALSGRLVDTVQGAADLLAFGRAESQIEAIRRGGRRLAAAQASAGRAAGFGSALVALVADLTCLAVIVAAVPAVLQGRTTGPQLAVAALVALAAFESVSGLPAAFQGLSGMRSAAVRLREIVDLTPEVTRPNVPANPQGAFRLEARGLSFTYPGTTAPALSDIAFQLEPGRLVAVVGPSGAGKSTLANLLLRFWDVPPATLFLGGHDVRGLDPAAVRARFGFVSQRVHLLNATLRDNLRLGRGTATDPELRDVLGEAGLGTFLARQPAGLDTWLGEQGARLSGGERQRVALARALLAESDCLLLDEPTAHLDAVGERALLESLETARRGRAALLITHRLAGLEVADEILVLERGRVVERGGFAALSRGDGPFARMLSLQRAEDVVEGLAASA